LGSYPSELIAAPVWKGRGSAWLTHDGASGRHWLAAARWARAWFPLPPFRRVEATVLAEFAGRRSGAPRRPQPFLDRLSIGSAILDGRVPAGASNAAATMGDYGPGNFLIGLWKGLTTPGAELRQQLEKAGPGETAGAIVGPSRSARSSTRSGKAALCCNAEWRPASWRPYQGRRSRPAAFPPAPRKWSATRCSA
jgi:hypothetical protein